MVLNRITPYARPTLTQVWELAQAALGLWLVPFAPLAIMVLVAWSAEWAFPALVVLGFMLGWPATWFLWLNGADDENAHT
jgi:hypothetical protein